MKSPVAAAIAIAVGLITLLGYFLTLPVLVGLRSVLLGWAIILAAAATWVGILNMLGVHWRKIRTGQPGGIYSGIVIIAFIVTVGLGMVFGPTAALFQKIFTSIQVPVEASLMAVLAVSLAYASVQLLRRRLNWVSLIFILSVLVFLVMNSGLLPIAELPIIKDILSALLRLPVAGARGILLGVALGSLATGLRILMGADRPYRG